jgi:hypothetical protein
MAKKFIRLPQFRVFKGSGALQMELQPAMANEDGTIEAGCAMLTMAPSTGKKDSRNNPTYDWANTKIVMKMSDKDLTDLYLGLVSGEKKSIVHDPNAGTGEAKVVKTLSIAPGQQSGYFLTMTFQDMKASVPLNDNEIMRLRMLIPAAMQAI